MPFRLGKHFEVAILVRVYQGHHGHTAQCRPGGGEALRLERIEARGEAKVRQELALEGVAHGGDDGALADVKLRGQRVVEKNHDEEVESVERPAGKAGGNGVRRAARAMLSG